MKLLTELRTEIGLDLSTIALLLGTTRQCVNYWINGDREIPTPVGKLLKLLIEEPRLINKL